MVGLAHLLLHGDHTQRPIILHTAAFSDRKSEMETPPEWLVKGGSSYKAHFHAHTSTPRHSFTLSNHETTSSTHREATDGLEALCPPAANAIAPLLKPAASFSS